MVETVPSYGWVGTLLVNRSSQWSTTFWNCLTRFTVVDKDDQIFSKALVFWKNRITRICILVGLRRMSTGLVLRRLCILEEQNQQQNNQQQQPTTIHICLDSVVYGKCYQPTAATFSLL